MSRLSDNRMALTKAAIGAIRSPETGRTRTFNTQPAGLALYVTATGTATYYVAKKVLEPISKPGRAQICAVEEVMISSTLFCEKGRNDGQEGKTAIVCAVADADQS